MKYGENYPNLFIYYSRDYYNRITCGESKEWQQIL